MGQSLRSYFEQLVGDFPLRNRFSIHTAAVESGKPLVQPRVLIQVDKTGRTSEDLRELQSKLSAFVSPAEMVFTSRSDRQGYLHLYYTWVGDDRFNPQEELWGADPNCKHNIISAPGGGVKCTKCPGWFCF